MLCWISREGQSNRYGGGVTAPPSLPLTIGRKSGSRTRSVRARFSDHAGLAKCSRWRAWTYCLPLHRQCRHPELVFYRGSMAGLHVPLPTLRRHPRGCLRTAWGRCGCRVEVLVTQHLPHRSHRAAFPQWALVEGQTRSRVRSLAAPHTSNP